MQDISNTFDEGHINYEPEIENVWVIALRYYA